MADQAPRQPFQNVRQRGVADNRRTRPTTNERFVAETKRGSEEYRAIKPQSAPTQPKARGASSVSSDSGFISTPTPTPSSTYGPIIRPELTRNAYSTAKKFRKKGRTMRMSWVVLTGFWFFYFISLIAVIISMVGAGLSITGEEAVNWVPFVGRWLAGYAGNPGEYVFAAGYVVALILQSIILGATFAAYGASRIDWWKHWQCWVYAIFAAICVVAPFLQLIPATFFFMVAVLYYVK
jgi:hypothetical protein